MLIAASHAPVRQENEIDLSFFDPVVLCVKKWKQDFQNHDHSSGQGKQ